MLAPAGNLLSHMTILTTGGCGFIGSNFILCWLQKRDEPVVNLDKLSYAGNPENLAELDGDPRYTLIRGDIADIGKLQRVFAEHSPRAVVHFAAESHVDHSIAGPADFIHTNITGTFQLLEATHNYWQRLRAQAKENFRFLHISTDEVYGSLPPNAPPFAEDHPYRPNSPYSASKAASDHLVRAWHKTYGLPVLTTNCSNNYGPRQFPEKLIPLMIHRALAGETLPVYGDGLNIRDWLYVEDHCQALMQVLDSGRPGVVYNIGGMSELSNLQVVHHICEMLDRRVPGRSANQSLALIRHIKDRLGHDRRYAMNIGRIQQELGWKPEHGFLTGLSKTIEWYLQNPDWVAHAIARKKPHATECHA